MAFRGCQDVDIDTERSNAKRLYITAIGTLRIDGRSEFGEILDFAALLVQLVFNQEVFGPAGDRMIAVVDLIDQQVTQVVPAENW